MKRLPAVLAVSLVTNLLLAAAWWSAPPPSSAASNTADAAIASPSKTDAPASATTPASPPPPQTWAELTDGIDDNPADDVRLVERLRAANFDDDTIRDLLWRRIKDRYVDREVALIEAQPRPEYWSQRYTITMRGPLEQRAALRQLRLEQNAQLDALLGPAAESAEDRRARERRFGPLPRETAEKLKDLFADYRDLAAEARAEMNGFSLPSDREDLALIEEARMADLAALLTPEQLEAYLVRSGPVGSRLRQTLTEFAPTETEFLSLYALQNAFEQQWGTSGPGMSREQRQAVIAARQELDAQIAATLGPERYADYQVLTHPQYRFTKQLTDRLGLPAENARAAAQLQMDTTARMRELFSNRDLAPNARIEQLAALQQSVRDSLQPLLTADGLAAYEGSGVGQWISRMVPVAPPPQGGN